MTDTRFYSNIKWYRTTDVNIRLKRDKLENSKEFFREMIVKYFIEYPNVKIRLQEKLKYIEDIKIVTILNKKQITKHYPIIYILKAFVEYYKEHANTKNLVSDFIADFMEFLDLIEDLAKQSLIELQNIQTSRETILKIIIKSYYRRKQKKHLYENVVKVNKLYTISYIGLQNNGAYINREILIECDKQIHMNLENKNVKINVDKQSSNKNFDTVFPDGKILSKPKQLERLKEESLKNYFGQAYDEELKSRKPIRYSQNSELQVENCQQAFIENWLENMDFSINLFKKSQKHKKCDY